jgi:hypothetical protein
LSGIGTHVSIIFSHFDVWECGGIFDEFRDIDYAGDVGAAVADEDADFGLFC